MTEGHRTLGTIWTPTISFKSEVEYLERVHNKIAGYLRRDALEKNEARLACCTMHLPKVCYSASVACLTSEQCWEVEHKALRAFLLALGYNSNMSHPVAFAPSNIGRVGITSINTELGA